MVKRAVAIDTREHETLRWQFDLVWRLANHHLPLLTDRVCLWEPAAGSWSVRPGSNGIWQADWSEPVPDAAPPVTIGWLSWHILWWWSSAISVVEMKPLPQRGLVAWTGSARGTVQALDALSARWLGFLSSNPDLARPVAYPWSEPSPSGCFLRGSAAN